MRRDLPSGTVTFLFTDVAGSTRLLHELGAEAYADALAEHRALIREACTSEGGVEVDTQGDAFFFAFPEAQAALDAARGFTQSLASTPIRVRVGLHTGTPLLAGEGYVGDDVHFAARVAAAGHGGQVLVSDSTAELVEEGLTSLGSHRLKDIQGAVSLHQLGEGSFPPLKTIANTNLPTPASSFLGREEELHEADELLRRGRLLTITGPGGAGKTRFALELASRALEERFRDYADGVFSCFFSSLRDPALVLSTIAHTLSVPEQPGRSALESLASHLEGKKTLLLLDNLEHVLEAAPELSRLLSACPGLTLLCTSRELLRISGEEPYALPPLPKAEAVSLFCERSRLEPTPAIASLCQRLEGLPLALELAAARTAILTPAQLEERLSFRLDLLKGTRDADPRQQTLRATIEWSYDLLTREEQRLFARLSVFQGGCTLEAAEEVCDADLDSLQSLVDKSLLRFTDERFWMLETIREHAGQKLDEAGETEEYRERLLTWMDSFADRADKGLLSPDVAEWLDRVDREVENLRAALERARATLRADLVLSLMYRTGNFWYTRGLWREAREWVHEALARADPEPTIARAEGLASAMIYAHLQGDFDAAGVYGNEALSIFLAYGDDKGVGWLLNMLGARASEIGDVAEAERLFRRSQVHARKAGDRSRLALATGNLGEIVAGRGEYDEAVPLLEEAVALARGQGRADLVSAMLHNVAFCRYRMRQDEKAAAAAREAVEIAGETRDVESLTLMWPVVAAIAIRRGRSDAAAEIIGFGDAQCERGERDVTGKEAELRAASVAELRTELGNAGFEAAAAAGRDLELREALETAVTALSDG